VESATRSFPSHLCVPGAREKWRGVGGHRRRRWSVGAGRGCGCRQRSAYSDGLGRRLCLGDLDEGFDSLGEQRL